MPGACGVYLLAFVFLSGLRGHLPGLSHLNSAFYILVAGKGLFFPFFILFFSRRAFFSLFFSCFFIPGTCYMCTSMSSSINVRLLLYQVRADQSATTQADRVGLSQHVVEDLYSSLCSQTYERIEICPAYENIQTFAKQLSWCDARRLYLYTVVHCSFSPFFLFRP